MNKRFKEIHTHPHTIHIHTDRYLKDETQIRTTYMPLHKAEIKH